MISDNGRDFKSDSVTTITTKKNALNLSITVTIELLTTVDGQSIHRGQEKGGGGSVKMVPVQKAS